MISSLERHPPIILTNGLSGEGTPILFHRGLIGLAWVRRFRNYTSCIEKEGRQSRLALPFVFITIASCNILLYSQTYFDEEEANA